MLVIKEIIVGGGNVEVIDNMFVLWICKYVMGVLIVVESVVYCLVFFIMLMFVEW